MAMKIMSPDITHKSDVGGVVLNINRAQAVRHVYSEMMEQVKNINPDARLEGVSIEKMYRKTSGRELMVGVIDVASEQVETPDNKNPMLAMFRAEILPVVVAAGETDLAPAVTGVTAPTPLSIERLVAPVTVHDRVLLWPALIEVGLAVKLVITGN